MTSPIEKWDFFETSFAYQCPGNPFLDVSLSASFTHEDQQVHVEGFYDGDGVYRVRFMPGLEGRWQFVTRSSAPELDGRRGDFYCAAPAAGNHGLVRVANKVHFAYADGAPYKPVGTTCYVWNLQGDALEERTLKTLDDAPFNKMRMCVFPKRYTFNRNEPPCYPFEGKVTREWDPALLNNYRSSAPPEFWDFDRFNPAYFRRLENRILDLRARGIEADLILFHPYDFGAWGFDRMPAAVSDRYLRYLVARLAPLRNLWWSFANEYDLFFERKMEDWDHAMRLVQQADPYDHLRSIHNCGAFYDHTKPWVTHCSVQSHALNRVPAWLEKYQKPVVVDECGYEGDIHMVWGDLSPEEMVARFWLGFVQGGYVGHGETYVNDEEVLWWSKGGELHGESAPRIAFLREIIEGAPWLTPIPKVDNEFNNLMDSANQARLPGEPQSRVNTLIAEGSWNIEAAGYNIEEGYYLLYYGMHQPGSRYFNLEGGSYRVDIIDTWNMTIETAAEHAAGRTRVEMPGRKYMAVRIQKNELRTKNRRL
jgi:hypothetical protein